MTTISMREQTCAVCGATENYVGNESSNAEDHDLDGRPRGMVEFSSYGRPFRCPTCGYCCVNLEFGAPGIRELVFSAEYQELVNSPDLPEEARAALGMARVAEHVEAWLDAMRFALMAAWDCDDVFDSAGAVRCRVRALENLARLEAEPDFAGFDAESLRELRLVRIELHRRMGDFDSAMVACGLLEDLASAETPDMRDALLFERTLIVAEDTAAHRWLEVDPAYKRPAILL